MPKPQSTPKPKSTAKTKSALKPESPADRARAVSIPFVVLMTLGAVGLYFGWRIFWFLTDDAFIEYRYVSNSINGAGLVWNARPFLPVEGYTSFLWVALLEAVWRVLAIDPPSSANAISLVFSYGSLVLAALMIARIPWRAEWKRFRMWFVALLLIGTLSNRTFLTWTSSGLETAMFGFLVTWWVFTAVTVSPSRKRMILLSCVSALLALARPDGLLFVGVTGALALMQVRGEPNPRLAIRAFLISVSPLAVILAHEAWRLSFYGAWLPNTYYAKVVEPWPSSGVRYAASYILEYCLWFPILALMALQLQRGIPRPSRGVFTKLLTTHVFTTAAIVAVVIHLAYYTLIVGGDHFEYRVYSYTVPLFFVALAGVLNHLTGRVRVAILLTITSILLAAPVPWTHWNKTRHLNTRKATHFLCVPIAPAWPKPVAWYARMFDRQQRWLIYRMVCTRHQEHKMFWRHQVKTYRTRAEGASVRYDDFAVHAVESVGVAAWVFPHANIIDMFGLNDYVVARTPYPETLIRRMAHGRRAPEGYVESYQPNLTAKGVIKPRGAPLTATRIACLEHYWRAQLPRIRRGEHRFDDVRACYE